MELIDSVYWALRTFARGATRAEIERESGLGKDEVWKGLRGLLRRGVLIVEVEPRKPGLYRLTVGAPPPADLRGRYKRDDDHRSRMAKAKHSTPGYSPARPPSHHAEPGAARLVKKGLALRSTLNTRSPCALVQVWRKR